MVREALQKAGREDLIGYSADCLVRPAGGSVAARGTKPGGKAQGAKSTQGKKPAVKSGAKPSAKPATKSGAAPVAKTEKKKPTYKAGWAKPKKKK